MWVPSLHIPLGLPPRPPMRVPSYSAQVAHRWGGWKVGAGPWLRTAPQWWETCGRSFHEPQSKEVQGPPHTDVRKWGLGILARGQCSLLKRRRYCMCVCKREEDNQSKTTLFLLNSKTSAEAERSPLARLGLPWFLGI